MSGEKRPAQRAFGPGDQQLLVAKRKKSDNGLNTGTAVVKSSGQNGGALVQTVCPGRLSLVELFVKPIADIHGKFSATICRFPGQVDWMLQLWN